MPVPSIICMEADIGSNDMFASKFFFLCPKLLGGVMIDVPGSIAELLCVHICATRCLECSENEQSVPNRI